MMRALYLQQLAKRHISGQSDVEQWRNQAHSLSGYQLMVVWRHQSDSQSVEKSVKYFITIQYKGLELIWRHFWAWLCLTNAVMLSESKYLADFLVGFLGKKPQTLLISIYSTTVLYDKTHENHTFIWWVYHVPILYIIMTEHYWTIELIQVTLQLITFSPQLLHWSYQLLHPNNVQ